MPEYEKDTLYRPETKKSGGLAYKIGQAIAVLMSLCASAIIVAATIKLIMGFCKEVLQMNEEKEVYFDQYCKTCKHHGLEESKDPCNDCLAEPSNTNSHKPMNYESKNNS